MADQNNTTQATSPRIVGGIVTTLCVCAIISLLGVVAGSFSDLKVESNLGVLKEVFVMTFTAITALLASTKTLITGKNGNGNNGNGQ